MNGELKMIISENPFFDLIGSGFVYWMGVLVVVAVVVVLAWRAWSWE